MNLYKWRQINRENISSDSGVYAWYYNVKLGKRDISDLIFSISKCGSDVDKKELVDRFFERYLFGFFKEDPYFISLSGPLKPSYKGNVLHESSVSSTLIEKIIDTPEMLYGIRESLADIGGSFSSPIYIGMARDLRSRLSTHKRLIELYKQKGISVHEDVDERDQNFAARVVERGFIETNLQVAVTLISTDESLHNVMENLLNRINYPILGRN